MLRTGDPVALGARSGKTPVLEPATGVQATAYVNHGRWVANCPFCTGAEVVDPAQALLFCCSCGNAEAGGRVVKVQFPSAEVQAQIEVYLGARPVEENQNWYPHESANTLRDENVANGVRW